MTPSGHTPRPLHVGESWLIEGTCVEATGRSLTRLLVDTRTGTIRARGDLAGEPIITLEDGQIIIPGVLDVHVHCRDDPSGKERYKEDFESASRAALHGGVVLIGDMPNNPNPPVDAESYAAKRALADERALVDVMLYGGIGPGTRPFSNAIPYKCYYGPSIGNLDFTKAGSPGIHLRSYDGQWISFHAEAFDVLEESRDAPTHEARRPAAAEARAIAEIAEIARELSIHAHIAHLSSAVGLGEVRRARSAGVEMSCEVTPHHLFFDVENRGRFARGDWLQMNPPLRTPEDRLALREAFVNGEIDALASDHAPHTPAEKAAGISGVPHLDTMAPFLALLADEGIPWEMLVDRSARSPARLFAPFIPGSFGSLEEASAASFTVLDLRRSWTVRTADIRSRSAWSPFEGLSLPAQVILTAVRGTPYVME